MKQSKIFKNIVTGFGGQLIAIILGLVVPRLFISSYGSDVNGLLSTITQIFTYLALLEAGIGQAARNLLFKPFQNKDANQISEVASIASCYFRKFTVIYGIGVIILSIILPYFVVTNVDSITIFWVAVLEGLSGVISFYFIQTPSIIIAVDGKSYINNSINLLNRIVGYAVKIIMASLGLNIVLLQLVYFMVTVAKVIFYNYYFKKHYNWILLRKKVKNIELPDRKSYVLTEICWTIFSSTDMIVLSTFLTTKLSSVYGVYNMIFANITILVNAVYSSLTYILGHNYHKDIKSYEIVHDAFTSIFLGMVTITMSVCCVLTIPFVRLYTRGVADVNYIYPMLPLLFGLIQMISWSRYVSGNLTGLAGYAKQTSYISLIEAVINLTLSIVLVQKYGIIGVTIATVVALPLKVIWCTYISDKKVMHRSYKKTVAILGVNYGVFFFAVFLSKIYYPAINNYLQFIIWGIIFLVFFLFIYIILNIIVNKNCWNVIRSYVLKK